MDFLSERDGWKTGILPLHPIVENVSSLSHVCLLPIKNISLVSGRRVDCRIPAIIFCGVLMRGASKVLQWMTESRGTTSKGSWGQWLCRFTLVILFDNGVIISIKPTPFFQGRTKMSWEDSGLIQDLCQKRSFLYWSWVILGQFAICCVWEKDRYVWGGVVYCDPIKTDKTRGKGKT
jgi:hypothetical protein